MEGNKTHIGQLEKMAKDIEEIKQNQRLILDYLIEIEKWLFKKNKEDKEQ